MNTLSRRQQGSGRLAYQVLEARQLLAGLPIITEFLASNNNGSVDDNGNRSDWIEIYNAGDASINLAGFTLTDNAADPGKWTFPSVNLAVGQFLVVRAATDAAPASGTMLYTGFALSADGEYVGLYDPSGVVRTEYGAGGTNFPTQYSDVSYGLRFGGSFNQISYFSTPTPGTANINPVAGLTSRVQANVAAGFYNSAIQVSLSAAPGETIRYTTNGSTPSASIGLTYLGPINMSSTTNLRAIAVRSGYLSVPSRTWSYVFVDDVLTQSNNGVAPAGWPASWGSNVVDYGIDPDVIAIEGAQRIKDALLAIPSWSITTDLNNLFNSSTGIYANPGQEGDAWERPASVELLNPNGSAGFQANAGLRIRGGFSRSTDNPKHSFRLLFKTEYGDSSLEYPLFPGGASSFKNIDLRTAQNYSWSFGGDGSNNFIAEVLSRDAQIAMGQPSTRSTWLHLYLNGQYWGLYQTQERSEAEFAASYFGGTAEDYDVIKAESGPYQNVATDGNLTAYTELFQQALARSPGTTTPNFFNQAAYLRAQGLNPDGSRNPGYKVLLDVDNLITYMTVILAGGNLDAPISAFIGNDHVNNYYAIRNRSADQGFRFFAHDNEHTLRNVNENRNGPHNHANFESGVSFFNPQWLHQQLMANVEYRMRFADSIYKNYFNGGPMTYEAQLARLNGHATAIDQAILAESARWGDAKRATPFLRSDWLNAVNDVRNNYLPARNAIFLNQLRNTVLRLKDTAGNYNIVQNAPLFPAVDAPTYLINGSPQSGGLISAGSQLRMTSNVPTVYYTLDGSDPRLPGDGISPSATAYNAGVTNATLIATGASWKYRDNGIDLGQAWRQPSFDDSAWSSGNSQLGYGDGDEATVVSFGGNANNKHITTYFRKTINVAAGNFVGATLRIKRDDGVAIYLNGDEILRNNLPEGDIGFSTIASIADDDGNTWFEFPISPALLLPGNNTIAAEIHQVDPASSDISFDLELLVSTSSAAALTLNGPTTISSRSRSATGVWSALHRASYYVQAAAQTSVRISELNYHPYEPTSAEAAAGFTDKERFEFLELYNSSPTGTVNLSGMQFSAGITLVLGNVQLGPGERAMVVKDTAAFQFRYGSAVRILGQYGGSLSNGGERVTLVDSNLAEVMSTEYNDNDPWSVAADGLGATLVLNNSAGTPINQLGKYYSWRPSVEKGGSPGAVGAAPQGVVINEVRTNSGTAQNDAIELFNPTNNLINIGGWFLSDAGDTPFKYQIAPNTLLGPGQYLVFDETDFNPTPLSPLPHHFALNGAEGDQVYLTRVLSPGVPGFEDVISFDASFEAQTLARFPNATGRLLPSLKSSLGGANADPKVGPLVISEFNYHPALPSSAALAIAPTMTRQQLEFVEIKNPTLQTINLTNWRLRGQLDFDFAAGTILLPGETIVVITFDPLLPANTNLLSAFRTHYGIGTSVRLVGTTLTTNLNDSFGRISLQRPDVPPPTNPTLIPRVLVDEVVYDDLSPWDASADGNGPSLNRIVAGQPGTLANNWTGQTPTPGTANLAASVWTRGLFYNNSSFDGNSGAANAADDGAFATTKSPLFNGQTATFANYSNYLHGINGLMIDVFGLSTAPTASNFQFRVGNVDNTSTWTTAPSPVSITVRPGSGAGEADRVSLVWANGAIVNKWLQVTMTVNGITDVFYFGNAIGETGNDANNAIVNLLDVAATRNNQTGFANAGLPNIYDFNRDNRVNLVDVAIARTNQSGFTPLRLITPGTGSRPGGGSSKGAISNSIPSRDSGSKSSMLTLPFFGDQFGGDSLSSRKMAVNPIRDSSNNGTHSVKLEERKDKRFANISAIGSIESADTNSNKRTRTKTGHAELSLNPELDLEVLDHWFATWH